MKKSSVMSVLIALVAVGSASAQAALPAWGTSMVTDAATAGTDAAAAVGPVIGAVMVALIVIKLIKRFSSKI